MTRRAPSGRARALLVALVVIALGTALGARERASVEHANRLYREGRVRAAEVIYRARATQLLGGPVAYNLGTALMTLGAPDAEEFLRGAIASGDSAAAQRGHYNLGSLFLAQYKGVARDSALALLAAAVGSSRAALRLDPRDSDARWNLSLAHLMLDSLARVTDVDTRDEERPREEGGIVIRQIAQLGPRRGQEREAAAGDDPPPMSEAEALALVQTLGPDAEALVRGLLWAHRPNVRPWEEPYPGGNW